MALISQKLTVTITDENDPTTTQVIDFTDDAYENYWVMAASMDPFDHTAYASWLNAPAQLIFDATASTQAGYVVIKTDNPIYVWFGRTPARIGADPDDPIDETVTPKITVSNCLVVSGGVTKVYAIIPSKDDDAPPLTAHVKTTIVY